MFTNYKKKYKIAQENYEHVNGLNQELHDELKKARDLKEVLTKLTDKTLDYTSTTACGGHVSFEEIHTSMFATDMVTGRKIILENGIKCIKIAKDGDVEVGLTEEAPDKGYEYRLIR